MKFKENNPDIYKVDEDRKHDQAIKKCDDRNRLLAIADKIAESNIYTKNWLWPRAAENFPDRPAMHYIDKYYPYAKRGPLLVDEPSTEADALISYEKQKVLKKLGHRSVVIERDSTLADILDQLGEL